MMKYSNKIAAVMLSSLLGLAVALPSVAVEAAENAAPAKQKKRKTYTLSERVGKKIAKIYDLYAADQIDEAITLALAVKAKKPYDKAYISRFLGSMYAGQKGKGKTSIKYLQMAVDADILSTSEHSASIRTLADLQMQEKMFNKAIANYKSWMNFTGKQDAGVWVRIGHAYMELKQLDKVIGPADKAIALYKDPNKNPYLLKLGSYFERKQYKNAIKVSETLVQLFPEDKKYWVQLGQFYMVNEQYDKALATMHIAYINGYLKTASQIKVLAQLYANNNIPHRSALVLEKFIKTGLIDSDERMLKTLAGSWHQAKELKKAIKYYGQAAAVEDNGDLYYKQGLLSFELEEYGPAIKSLNRALKSKNLKKRGNAIMTIAQAHFYSDRFKPAYRMMKKAAASDNKSVAKNAKLWLKHIKESAKTRKIAYQ